MQFRVIAVLSALATTPGLLACDLCAIYNANGARAEGTRGFAVTLAEQFTHSGTLQHEGAEVADPFRQYRDSSITSLILSYNIHPRFGMTLNLPYIHRAFRRVEEGELDEGIESGLGDIALLARFGALAKLEHDYSYSLSFLGGIEFPTGDSARLKEEVDEVETPGAPPSGVHGNDLALGSGSFDALIGALGNVRWRRFFFTTDAQYFIRTQGDFGYRFGNELSISSGPGVYVWFAETKTLAVQAAFSYESKARDRVNGVKRDDGIVTAWYASPGLVFTFGEHFSATANIDIPLRIYNRAFQTVPDYRVRGGITYRF